MGAREAAARWLNVHFTDKHWAVAGDMGAIGYYSSMNIIDAYCLNSAEYNEPPVNKGPYKFVDFIFSKKPEVILLTSRNKEKFSPKARVWRYLNNDPKFVESYRFVERFSARGYHYWAYTRQPH